MPNRIAPECDQWYCHLDKGQRFFVSAIDEEAGTIEIQHFDGDLEEVTLQEWREMNVEECAAPENWAGPLDFGSVDDLGTEVTDTYGSDWNEPLTEFPSEDEDQYDTGTGQSA